MSSAGTDPGACRLARRIRWAAAMTLATLAFVLLSSGALYVRMRKVYLNRETDGELQQLAAQAAEALASAPDRPSAEAALERLAASPGVSVCLLAPWRFDGGHLRQHPGAADLSGVGAEPRTVPSVGLGYPYRAVSREVRFRGGPARLVAAVYLKTLGRRLSHLRVVILWTGVACALAAWGVSWWASGRLFGPLEEAYRRESAFAADVAHELRTPLTALTGELEVALRSERTPEEYRDTLASALEEARRLSSLVGHLLFLARADAGQERLAKGEADLARICREAAEAFAPVAEEKGLRLVVDAPEHLPCRGDAVRLRQAVANLIDNAVRHTVRGSVCLRASHGRIVVEDTGPGVPPDILPRLFERFAKGAGSPGSGLGLAFVKWVAEAHGGGVEAESGSGGARFTVRLAG